MNDERQPETPLFDFDDSEENEGVFEEIFAALNDEDRDKPAN